MIKAGLVGLGWWGTTLLSMLEGSTEMCFVAATDTDPMRAATAERSGARVVESFEDMLMQPDIDAVVLCTPHDSHAEQIIAAAAAGKHVFREKPLCMTRVDAERAVAACRSAGVVLGVGHERRFDPPITDLMARIARGDLGQILQVEGNFNQDKFLNLPAGNWRTAGKGSVGPMTATGIHILDLATALLGPAVTVYASLRQLATAFENGDSLALMVGFESRGRGADLSHTFYSVRWTIRCLWQQGLGGDP